MASTLLEGHKVSHLRDSLYYIPNYLSGDEADALWRHIYAAPKPKWTVLKNRRLQNWGGVLSEKGLLREELPDWLRGCTSKLDAAGLFDGRNADHVLINEYLPGQGIMAHEDGPFFYPVIVNITLGSHTMLELSAKETTSGDDADGDTASRVRIGKVLLQPNSMMVMRDDLYSCLHGIDEIAEDVVDESVLNAAECGVSPGTVMPRGTRVSLTIRSAMRSAKLPVLRLAKSSK